MTRCSRSRLRDSTLGNLGRMAEATPLPRAGILSVVDVKGTILARKPAMPEAVGGKLWNQQVIEEILTNSEGVFEAKEPTASPGCLPTRL